MRWRVAPLIALAGIAAVPASSSAARAAHPATLRVSVKPAAGSVRTHFAVSFRSALSTGPSFHNVYRITAGGPQHGGCQSSTAATAPATKAGSIVHVVLAPARSGAWCAGTFRGQVWEVIVEACPVGKACPAIMPLPHVVGTFTFRVAHG